MARQDTDVGEAPLKKVSQSEARNQFASIVQKAMAGVPILVEHRGRPTVMIVAADEYARRVTAVRPELAEELRSQFLAENHEALTRAGAPEAIEGTLFYGSLKARIAE